MVDVNVNDDYACMGCKRGFFYYGYEVTKLVDRGDNVMITAWCFEFDNGVEKVTWAWTEIGAKDQFDVVHNLLLGMGKLFEEGIPIRGVK